MVKIGDIRWFVKIKNKRVVFSQFLISPGCKSDCVSAMVEYGGSRTKQGEY